MSRLLQEHRDVRKLKRLKRRPLSYRTWTCPDTAHQSPRKGVRQELGSTSCSCIWVGADKSSPHHPCRSWMAVGFQIFFELKRSWTWCSWRLWFKESGRRSAWSETWGTGSTCDRNQLRRAQCLGQRNVVRTKSRKSRTLMPWQAAALARRLQLLIENVAWPSKAAKMCFLKKQASLHVTAGFL